MPHKVVWLGPSRICFGRGEVRSSFIQSSQVNSVRKQSHPLFFTSGINAKGTNRFNIIQRIYVGELGRFNQGVEESRSISTIDSFTKKPVLTSRGESFCNSLYVIGRRGCFQNIKVDRKST